MKKLFFVRREKLQMDRFTYGAWRQYVAFLPDDTAVCCRHSAIPFVLALIGFMTMGFAGVAIGWYYAGVFDNLIWANAVTLFITGMLLMLPKVILRFTSWRLMVALSAKMQRGENGSFWRDF